MKMISEISKQELMRLQKTFVLYAKLPKYEFPRIKIAEKNNEEGLKMFSELSEEYSDVLAGIKQLETTKRVLKITPLNPQAIAKLGEKRRALEEFCSTKQHIVMSQNLHFWRKIGNIKSFGDFKKKFCRKIDLIRRNISFIIHEWMVSLFYGKDINPPFVFQTSLQDVEKIRIVLDSSKQLKFASVPEKRKRGHAQMNKELYELMSINQTWFEVKRNVVYDNFINKIEPILRDFLKSPFIVVSLTAWKTKPDMDVSHDSDGNRRGPNLLHKDGYPPGHFKCMVYLGPLNDACGRVQVEGEIIESERPGCSVIFDQERLHRSLPGNSEDRYCFEITAMRTLVEVDILKYYTGAPSSQHLLQAYHAYI